MIRFTVGRLAATPSAATTTATASSDPPPGVVMRGHSARSANTVRGSLAVLLGLLFVGVGAASALLLAGRIGVARGSRVGLGMPPLVAAPIGITFALVGFAFIVSGARDLRRRAALPALQARYAGQPWMWDYPWDRRGGRDETAGDIGRTLWVVAFMVLFLVPFHWIAFFSRERPVVVQLATSIFDLFLAAILARAVYLALRLARYGRSRIRFASFPFTAGKDVQIDLTTLSALARRAPMVATLRCVQERYETRRRGRDRERVTVCYELSRDERVVAAGEPSVRFALPPTAPSTALAELPPRYWELELRTDGVPGVDYGATFLVPVY